MSKSVLPPYYIFEAGSERKWPFWSSLLPPKECTHQKLNCWWSSITVIRCWSAFLKSSWTDSRPSSTLGRLVCHAMNADHITPVLKDLHWLCVQEKIQCKLYVLAFKCQHSLAPPYLSDQLQQVARMEPRQRLRSSSSQALVVPATIRSSLGGVTERFLSLPPGRGTVCRQQSLLRQPCIHSVEPWKLIYSPHLSHHLSYIIWIMFLTML